MSRKVVGAHGRAADGDLVTVPSAQVYETARRVLLAHGASAKNAEIQAELLLEGDLRDQHSHGVQRLPVLVGRITSGVLDPAADPATEHVSDVAIRIDGQEGFGPVSARCAVEQLIESAPVAAVSCAVIHRANHLGMLAPYTEALAEHGLIGIAMTTSEALVHAWGGAEALIGTNPISIAVPSGRTTPPLVLDMSTSQVSAGKILHHAARGMDIPPDWAVDESGRPTTDATRAFSGALTPFGGAKGYALGIALETVVATLSGTALGRDVRGTLDVSDQCTKGDVILAFSAQALAAPEIDAASYLDDIRSSGGQEPVAVPGDRARRTREQRLREGVMIPREIWHEVLELDAAGSKR